jgi:translation initiation factor IF-2
VRINELAKDLKISNKDLLGFLESAGLQGKSHSSRLDPEWVAKVKAHFASSTPTPAGEASVQVDADKGGEESAQAADAKKVVRKKVKRVIKRIVRRVAKPAENAESAPTGASAPTPASPHKGNRDNSAIARAIRAQLMRRHGSILKPREVEPDPTAKKELELAESVATIDPKSELARPQSVIPVNKLLQPVVEKVGGAGSSVATSPEKGVKSTKEKTDKDKARPKDSKKTDKPSRKRHIETKRRKSKLQSPRETLAEALLQARETETPIDEVKPVVVVAKPVNVQIAKRATQIARGARSSGRGKRSYRREKRERIMQAQEAQLLAEEKARTTIKVHEGMTVGDMASGMNIGPAELMMKLMGMGIMATINQTMDPDVIALIAEEYSFEIEETNLYESGELFTDEPDDPQSLLPRPPVVTVMGHVDHGKTKLLDALRETNVVDSEIGGITQKISAFQTTMNGQEIVFLDTPGHEAFSAMRARGAQVTDIVVLVVAANDGVMPQTVEAIDHAKASDVPIIVAVNKIDLAEANVDRVKQQLSEKGLQPEDWGGSTQFVEVSALKRLSISDLLESILLQAEMMELKANPVRRCRGAVIEARLDQGRGAVATVLVQKGMLCKGDPFVAGTISGRVRALFSDCGKEIESAGPSRPVEVLGFDGVPESGDHFISVENEKDARDISLKLAHMKRELALRPTAHVTLENLFESIEAGEAKELNVIIKGDVQGSVEAIGDALLKLSTEKVTVLVRHGGVGAISESDIYLADSTDAIIIGFSVRISPEAQSLTNSLGVSIKLYDVIFNIIEDVRNAMTGLLDKQFRENVIGRCEIREVFRKQRDGSVAGCYVTDGKMVRNAKARVMRGDKILYDGPLNTLKRFKDDAREVQTGYECGLGFNRMVDMEAGDIIECYEFLEVAQTL